MKKVQLILAVGLCVFGGMLLIAGFCCPPLGEIHHSVLIAFGEILTFSGALIGIDYKYRYKEWFLRQLSSIWSSIYDNFRNKNTPSERATKIFKNNSKIILVAMLNWRSSFDSRLIVFSSSKLGLILLSASLTPAMQSIATNKFEMILATANHWWSYALRNW